MSYMENLLSIVIDSDPSLFDNVDNYALHTQEVFKSIKNHFDDINVWSILYPNVRVPMEFSADVAGKVREVLIAKKDDTSLFCSILGYEVAIGDGSCPSCSLSTNYLNFDGVESARTIIKVDTRLFQSLKKTFKVKEMISLLVGKLNASRVLAGSASLQTKLNMEMQKNGLKLRGQGSLLWFKDKKKCFADCLEYDVETTNGGQFISLSDGLFDQDDPFVFQRIYNFQHNQEFRPRQQF